MTAGKKTYFTRKRIAKFIAMLFLLLGALLLFIRSEWGQQLLVQKLVDYVEAQTGASVDIERLYITFSGDIALEGFLLRDLQGDTLLHSQRLEADLGLYGILFQNKVALESLEWEGVRANIKRSENRTDYNFDFLIQAFADSTATTTETTEDPYTFVLGTISLEDIRLVFKDEPMGVFSTNTIGTLKTDFDRIDVAQALFHVDKIVLKNSNFSLKQTKPFPETTEDSVNTPLPRLRFSEMQLQDVAATYRSQTDSIGAEVKIGDFLTKIPKIDLNTNTFEIAELRLEKSELLLLNYKNDSLSGTTENTEEVMARSFEWPEYHVRLQNIKLKNNRFRNTVNTIDSALNNNGLAFSNINFYAPLLHYRPGTLKWEISNAQLRTPDGFVLKQLRLDGTVTDTELEVSKIRLQTNRSSLKGALSATYTSVNSLLTMPERTALSLTVPSWEFDLRDMYPFLPDLAKDEWIAALTAHPFKGRISAKGTLSEIKDINSTTTWGTVTSLALEGSVRNSTVLDSLSYNLDRIEVVSGKTDFEKLPLAMDSTLVLSQNIQLSGSAQGKATTIKTDMKMVSSLGRASFKGEGKYTSVPSISGNMTIDSLQLGTLLSNGQLGSMSLTGNFNLRGKELHQMSGTLNTVIDRFDFNGYPYKNFSITGAMNEGSGTLSTAYRDENLNFTSTNAITLSPNAYTVISNIAIIGADLNGLGVTENSIKIGGTLKTGLDASPGAFRFTSELREGVAVRDDEQYQMGSIDAAGFIGEKVTEASVRSTFLNLNFKANGGPDDMNTALTQQLRSYFEKPSDSVSRDTTTVVNLAAKIAPRPILTEVFFKGIEQLDTITLDARLNTKSGTIDAQLHAPTVVYNGAVLDSLHFSLKGDGENLRLDSGLANADYTPVNIRKTHLKAELIDEKWAIDFMAYDEDEAPLMHVGTEMQWAKDTVLLHIVPKTLLLQGSPWDIPMSNRAIFTSENMLFEKFSFSKGAQQLRLSNTLDDINGPHIAVLANKFDLQTFLSFLNPESSLLSGEASGRLVLKRPTADSELVADMQVRDLAITQKRLGNLDVQVNRKNQETYEGTATIGEGNLNVALFGTYVSNGTEPLYDLTMELKQLKTALLTDFFDTQLDSPKGFLSGKFSFLGTVDKPDFGGQLDFNGVSLKSIPLKTTFSIPKESIVLKENQLVLDDFLIADDTKGALTIGGTIGMENLGNPDFNLNVTADRFRFINSEKQEGAPYYGIGSIDADVTLSGNATAPIVEGRLRVREITELTYIIPEEQMAVEERDGIVLFVNKENPEAILTRKETGDPELFFGADVNLVLEIANDAVFTLVLDEKTGDMLQVAGDADLNLTVSPNGMMGLAGKYELKDGFYRTSLYNLVSRKFDLQEGSNVRWSGDPLSATLDVTAIYRLETSAAPLMASETSGVASNLASKYQQVMPFLVSLNVDGELMTPKISFALGVPDNAKDDLGGAVYGKVQQLNEQETALNKQVFSLLALNRFFPNTVSDGSNGGAAGLARNNVNKVLSGELNAFSEAIFDNSSFELDFDLDSFTDYSGETAQDRTQLNINASKKLFNDRLIVTAGSAVDVEGSAQAGLEETPIIGNVSLEYILTPNGRYRLKGFRKNEYVNVIDGQLIVTGLALIFNREFNEFSELFKPSATLPDPKKEKNGTKKNNE